MPFLSRLGRWVSSKGGYTSLRETNLKIVLVEIILFMLLAFSIGFYFNREDPLFLQNRHSIALHLLPLSVITLYYGFIAGAMYLSIFSALLYLIYGKVEGLYLLYLFLFLLILAEFHFYWNRVIQQTSERLEYVSDKLRGIARSLYVLKLSHDRLESYYISKPVSIRGFLEDIKRELLMGIPLEDALRRLFNLVSNIYAIERGGLYQFDGKGFKKLAEVGGMEDLNTEDNLVRYSMEREETAYIPISAVKGESSYLCFIPIYVDGSLKYAIAIQKMPFMNLNKDNVLAINVLFYYVMLDHYELDAIKDLYKEFRDIDVEAIKEINRCALLKKKYDVNSSLVLFTFEDWDESLYYFLSDNVRGLDLVSRCGRRSLMVLLPMTDLSGAYGFIRRIQGLIGEFKGVAYSQLGASHKTYSVDDARDILLKVMEFVQSAEGMSVKAKS